MVDNKEKAKNIYINLTAKNAFFKVTRKYIEIFGFERAALWSFIEEKSKRMSERSLKHKMKFVKGSGIKAENLIKNGFFYMTYQDVYELLRIKRNAFTGHIKFFRDNDLVEVIKAGMPPRNFYKIDYEVALGLLTDQVFKENEDDFLDDDNDDFNDDEEY